jgi:hypothetical protein
MEFTSTLVPAYGRDYRSKKAIQDALKEGRLDFLISDISSRWDGRYINGHDLSAEGYTSVWVRYDRLRKKAHIAF